MRKFSYDHNGLGLAEMTQLALTHAWMFAVVYWMVNHGMARTALKLTRMVI